MNRFIMIGVGTAAVLCGIVVVFLAPGPFADMFPATPPSSQNVATPQATTNDFTPPTQRLTNANPAMAGARQLLLATSSDGITFTPTGDRLTAQGNVPDAVVTADGTIFVYYIGQSISADEENTVVATSKDAGDTWSYHFLTFKNFPSPREPSDPDVVLLSDGTFRMFYTDSIAKSRIGIRYAESTDGLTFTYGGIALDAPRSVADSTTFFFNNQWTMFVIDHSDDFLFTQYRATSTDGISFTDEGGVGVVKGPTGEYFLSNPLIENNALRMFGFGGDNQSIQSFTSPDAITWTATAIPSLKANALSLHGGTYLQDSTVAKLTDGTYLMVYVTDMPE